MIKEKKNPGNPEREESYDSNWKRMVITITPSPHDDEDAHRREGLILEGLPHELAFKSNFV